jgi:hypothetical protein
VQVLPLLDGPVGGDPQGPQEFAAESVKLAARSAETIVDRILVDVSQLSVFRSVDGRWKLGDSYSTNSLDCSRTRTKST